MYILLVLFFASLLATGIMLGHQIKLIRSGAVTINHTEPHPLEPNIIKVKYHAKRSVKRYGYLALVFIFRIYFRAEYVFKMWYQESKKKFVDLISRKTGNDVSNSSPREVSGFLKMMSEYKYKLRNLRHKIKEEENK